MRLVLAALAALPLLAQSKPWFFVQLTDPQFGMHTADKSFEQETANFEFAVATVNRLKPRFVIITGDLVNKPGDPAQIAEYQRIVAKIDKTIPVYQLPGNHDVDNVPTPQTVAAYRKTFGEDFYTFRMGDFAGVVLNTTIIHSPLHVEAEMNRQRQWLEGVLPKLRAEGARQIVVFQHHPWFTNKLAEPDGYFNIPLARRASYVDLLAKHGVKQVFAGHTHRVSVAQDGGIEMIVTGPVALPLSDMGSGLRIGIVHPDRVEHTFHPFHRLPNQVKLD